jgi:hypothetical protein
MIGPHSPARAAVGGPEIPLVERRRVPPVRPARRIADSYNGLGDSPTSSLCAASGDPDFPNPAFAFAPREFALGDDTAVCVPRRWEHLDRTRSRGDTWLRRGLTVDLSGTAALPPKGDDRPVGLELRGIRSARSADERLGPHTGLVMDHEPARESIRRPVTTRWLDSPRYGAYAVQRSRPTAADRHFGR